MSPQRIDFDSGLLIAQIHSIVRVYQYDLPKIADYVSDHLYQCFRWKGQVRVEMLKEGCRVQLTDEENSRTLIVSL
ncbi:MAG: hypothetical protein AMXMBFR44_5700 [Candidatus Campbellbacteria bacterium]